MYLFTLLSDKYPPLLNTFNQSKTKQVKDINWQETVSVLIHQHVKLLVKEGSLEVIEEAIVSAKEIYFLSLKLLLKY